MPSTQGNRQRARDRNDAQRRRRAREALVVTLGAVERHVSSIFGKLELPVNEEDNRRVMAVLTYLRTDD